MDIPYLQISSSRLHRRLPAIIIMRGRKAHVTISVVVIALSTGWRASPLALDTAERAWKKNIKQRHDAHIVESKQGSLWEQAIVVANLIMTWGFENG